jgi:outer membrane lipoprotein-sorting protein
MKFKIIVILALCAAPLARAEALAPADTALVQRATGYLQHLTTAKGRFTQTNPRGQTVTGTFVLQRPGKARFDYDPPSGVTIASDGHRVAVLDRRLKTIQASPLGLTPLSLFLAKDIRLDRGVTVANVTRTPGGFIVVARDARKKTQGQIALDFSESPIALTGWTITDAGGGATRVKLTDFAVSAPREASFFVLQDPRPVAAAPAFN